MTKNRITAFFTLALLANMATPMIAQDKSSDREEPFLSHRPILVEGVHAYGPKKVEPGDALPLRVSSTVPYELSIVRLGSDPDSMAEDKTLFNVSSPARPQEIHPGSYVHIRKGLDDVQALTLESWVRAFDLKSRQGLITQTDSTTDSGFGLFLEEGKISFKTGSHDLESPSGYLRPRYWHHVSVTWDGSVKRIRIDGTLAAEAKYQAPLSGLSRTLKLAASSVDGRADLFFDGDLANCMIYNRALKEEEIRHHKNSLALTEPARLGLIGYWRFSEEKGSLVADSSNGGRDGHIVNHATWMIGGPSFDETRGPRLNPVYQPAEDPTRGHSLRFCSDDLYDCRWPVAHTFNIPEDARQGVYVARFKFILDQEHKVYNCTFVVRRPTKLDQPAPILVLCSTNSWLAYNCYPFAANVKAGLTNWYRRSVEPLSKPEYPGFSMYVDHRAGQPACQVGLNMPWPSAGPYKTYYEETKVFSQWTRGERFLHLWLENNNYEYDLLTDLDIDQQPELIQGYKTICVVGHSEYWTEKAYLTIQKYLSQGGTLTVMSGNSIFWRVSFDKDYRIMECRKYLEELAGSKSAKLGHLYHSQDGQRGGLMRYCGLPAWNLIGLETLGWKSRSGDFQSYSVEEPDHFLFNRPHKVGVNKGDLIGQPNAAKNFLGAVGHEYDARLSVLQDLETTGYLPPQFAALTEPQGMISLARCYSTERKGLDYAANGGVDKNIPTHVISDIIYWRRDDGGQVFNIGSVAGAWAVYKDEKMGLLLNNVLDHFGIKPKN